MHLCNPILKYRGKIYKYLGFDKSLFKEEINNLEYEINEYFSDMSTYKYVIDELENKEKDKSIFEQEYQKVVYYKMFDE